MLGNGPAWFGGGPHGKGVSSRKPPRRAAYPVHGALRCLGERANSLLKTTFKALRRWRGCPWRIGDVDVSPPGSSCSTTNTAAQRDPQNAVTPGDQHVARKDSVIVSVP